MILSLMVRQPGSNSQKHFNFWPKHDIYQILLDNLANNYFNDIYSFPDINLYNMQ